MIKIKDLEKVYLGDEVETTAVNKISLEVKEGEFIAVTGPSGSGKTTFLTIAGLLESFNSGSYMLDGQDVSQLNDNQRSVIRNEKIGFIFQNYNLEPFLV